MEENCKHTAHTGCNFGGGDIQDMTIHGWESVDESYLHI